MKPIRIGIVGPCASGKTTLVSRLLTYGYDARHIAQEHSYVPDMWKKITKPDILVYLQVSYPFTLQRRNLDWTEKEYNEQLNRLRHAHEHANLVVNTDNLSSEEVLVQVIQFLLTFEPL